MTMPTVASSLDICHPKKGGWLQVDCGNGWVDWPIQYPDGHIAYECPERVPKAAKRLTERAFQATQEAQS